MDNVKKLLIVFLLFIPSVSAKAYDEPIAGIAVPLENSQNLISDIICDVPIPFIYQVHTYAVCQLQGVDYKLALSVISGESNGEVKSYNLNDNGTIDKGLMQINSCNYEWLREELGITDFYDPYQNIECGVFMLADIMDRHTETHDILMCYNMGEKRVRRLNRQGIYSSDYSRRVVKKYDKLKRGRQ